jgi:hypothetical protein
MFKTVNVNCSRCGEYKTAIGDSEAIPGVDDSYVSRATDLHKNNISHTMAGFKENNPRVKQGLKPISSVVTGNLEDFSHGKDHNA